MAAILRKTRLPFVCLLVIAFSTQSLFAQYSSSRSEDTKNSKPKIINISLTPQSDNLVPLTASFTEGFDDGVIPAGWSIQNLSMPIGTNANCWNLLTTLPWTPQAGVGHIGANFDCTTEDNTISGWLFSPMILFHNGDQISFWTRTVSPETFPDRLELRLSLAGASTNAGATSTSVGDFTTVLVSVNPTLAPDVYPTTFTQFTATISGLGVSTNGRVAFRYFITNGGPNGDNSDNISIDTFNYLAVPTAANVSVGGYVHSPNGQGIPRAIVQMTSPSGNVRSARTGSFGYYRFDDVEVGESYVFTVFTKQYQFNPQIVSVLDNIQDLNFTAQ